MRRITNGKNDNIALTKVVALILVIAVHYLGHIKFYELGLGFNKTIVLLFLRNLSMTCVPLFLLVTGFLMRKKKYDFNYFIKIFPIIIFGLVASGVGIIYKIIILKEFNSVLHWVMTLFSFQGIGYSWYLIMYLGLYLLMPCLNIIVANTTRKENLLIIIVLFVVIILPKITYMFDLFTSGIHYAVIPAYWVDMYPIFYYLVGAFISKYPETIRVRRVGWWLIGGLTSVTILLASLLTSRPFNGVFWHLTDYNSFFTATISILLFLTLLKVRISFNGKLREIVYLISNHTLGIYLFSSLTDNILNKSGILTKSSLLINTLGIIVWIPLVVIICLCLTIICDKIVVIISPSQRKLTINTK